MGKAEKDRELAYKAVSKLYLQYVKIFRTLDSCYDQMVHPQKRMLLRKLLDSTIGRILELKHDLVNLDNLEYSYHEATMAELGYNPSEVELIVPKFVITDRTESIKYWDEQMAEAKAKMKDNTQEVCIFSNHFFEDRFHLFNGHFFTILPLCTNQCFVQFGMYFTPHVVCTILLRS